MDSLVKLIDDYKIFNNLVPGVLFVYLVGDGAWFNHVQAINIFVEFFIYYIAGSIIGRVGSLAIEAPLRKIGLLKFKSYTDFVKASKRDDKIVLFSQENNAYRTYTATFLATLVFNWCDRLFGDSIITTRESTPFLIGIAALLVLMLFSYWKQTGYVTKRIEINI